MKKVLLVILAVFLIVPVANAMDGEGYIARSQFTTEIVNREPANEVTSIQVGEQVSFFTDIRNMEGQTITHRWTQEGEELFSRQFHVGGPRWRVWTTKNTYDWNIGAMEISIVDEEGKVLIQKTINVTE